MFHRYAVYFTPPPGPLAAFGAAWLGWDPVAGTPVAQPKVAGLDLPALTATPRKYGLHATLKAPFRLPPERTEADLARSVEALAGGLAPVLLDDLHPVFRHGFVALRPSVDQTPDSPLSRLEAHVVRSLDSFRAPLGEAELARRRATRLTSRQDENLRCWGYPFVMEEFLFHLTLTGRVDPETGRSVVAILSSRLNGVLDGPFVLDALSLVGEDGDGRFHVIERFSMGAAQTAG